MCVKTKAGLCVLVCSLVFSSLSWAGVVYTIETTNYQPPTTSMAGVGSFYSPAVPQVAKEPQKGTVTIKAEGKKLAMAAEMEDKTPPQQKKSSMIFRGDKREMTVVDHEGKSYMILDQEKIKAMGQKANTMAGSVDVEEILKKVPPERREMVREMLKKQMPSQPTTSTEIPMELNKTEEKKVINGWPTTRYDVMQGGKKTRELWVTGWSNVAGGAEVSGIFGDMSEFLKEMLDAFPKQNGNKGFGAQSDMFTHLKELKGIPVLTKEFSDDGTLESESKLLSAKKQTLDAGAFEPPAGYKLRTFPGS